MNFKNNNESEEKQLALKISSEYRKRFNDLKDHAKLTQPEMFCELIDLYESKDPTKADSSILLIHFVRTPFNTPETYKISFKGKTCYESDWSPPVVLDSVSAQKLQQDFGVPIKYPSAYTYTHRMELHYHTEKQCYLAYEGIFISKNPQYQGELTPTYDFSGETYKYLMPKDVYQILLEVSRFHVINDCNDFYQKFGHYASNEDFAAVASVLAKDIGDDFSLLDKLFTVNKSH